ncbi:MAG TPA: GNAT family N-acetyltransferase [Pyrinomonadaceae bacterium]|jgi:GNAT superfamily N-acetyltransferase
MSTAVIIRRASRKDARAVGEMAEKLVIQHREYDAQRFSRLARSEQMAWFYGSQTDTKDAAVLVAEIDGEIVGFAYIQFEAKNYADLLESAAWLHDIYVEDAARRKNVGQSLLEASIGAAKALGATKLLLTVAAQNEIARKFFGQNGFRKTMVEMMFDLTGQKEND